MIALGGSRGGGKLREADRVETDDEWSVEGSFNFGINHNRVIYKGLDKDESWFSERFLIL